jgi:hypothetical protein
MKATVSAAVLRTHSKTYLMGTALALVLTASVNVQQAQAQACTQTGQTFDCVGAVNAGINVPDNTVVNVTQAGASITATGIGINAQTGNTINVGAGNYIKATVGDIDGFPVADGIRSPGNLTVTNSGTIMGTRAIYGGFATVTNNGGTIQGSVVAIFADANVNNVGGTITASDYGIRGDHEMVTNSGLIQATGVGSVAITGADNVTNKAGGLISGGGFGLVTYGGFYGDSPAIVTNAGTIQATSTTGASDGVLASGGNHALNLTNLSGGLISGFRHGVYAPDGLIVNVTNAGTITGGTGVGGTGILIGGGTIVNAGLVSGLIGISLGGASTITNSGTIASTAGGNGVAIKLSDANDTLNIKTGSVITGKIDLGGGTNVINVGDGAMSAPQMRGVSILSSTASTATIDALKQQIVNFDPLNDIINIVLAKSVQPMVTVNGMVASLDPTALAQQDRVLMDVAGGVSSTIQGRLGASSSAPGVQMMSYAMDTQMEENALGYATDARQPNSLNAKAQMFTKAPMWTKAPVASAPINVWTSGFGGVRYQQGTDTTLNSTSSVFGGTLGGDRQMRPDLLVGLFAGGGGSNLTVEQGSQKIDSDYVFGGAYAHKTWGASFVDTTLQVGGITNRSDRLVQNAITGGLEHAASTSHGWFISPEVAYGYHLNVGHGYTLTPIARARYVAGFFDGSSESGSAQTLSIGNRTLQDFEERAELEFSRVGLFGNNALKTTLHGGFIGLQRIGDTAISAVLIGQGITFATPGHATAAGGVFGASFDYAVAPNTVLFGAAEGQFMSDQSQTVSARGGFKVVF